MKKKETLKEMIKRVIKEEMNTKKYYENQLEFFDDVDFVPDSPEEIEKSWPEPYKSKGLKAWKIRKRTFKQNSINRKKQWE